MRPEERITKNQELQALGKMAFQILQVFIQRLESRHGPMLAEANKTMKLIHTSKIGSTWISKTSVSTSAPPMISPVPEYRRLRGLSDEQLMTTLVLIRHGQTDWNLRGAGRVRPTPRAERHRTRAGAACRRSTRAGSVRGAV